MHRLTDTEEEQRLKALREYNIVEEDTDFEYVLYSISAMCEVPLCSIVTVYKDSLEIIATTGPKITTTIKRKGSCTQYILDNNTYCEIEDIRNHDKIDYVSYVLDGIALRFFAGYPLIDPLGNSLGTLNLFDTKPRVLTEKQKKLIAIAAARIVRVFIDKREKQRLLHFDRMFSKSKDLIGIIRFNGEILEVNPSFYELMGYGPDEVFVKNILEFIHPSGMSEAIASLENLSSGVGEISYTLPSITKNSEIKWIEWTSTPEPATGLIYFIGRDVTLDHEKTVLLKNSESRFRALFENSQSMICTHDLEGNFISINRIGADMIGCTVDEAQGMNIKDLYPVKNHPDIMAFLAKIYKDKTLSVASEIINKKGEKRMWLLNSALEKNIDGTDYVIANGVDITDRYKMEEELRVATKKAKEASKAKSEFIANMSHEIRTPLNGVIGFTDLVLKTPLEETQKQYLKIINQSGATLLNIVDQILDFSKIESRKVTLLKEKIDLQSLALDACDMVLYSSEKKGLELLLDLQESLPRFVWADEIRLKQILVNLLSNAVKFTEKGEVKLSIHLSKRLPNNFIVLHFSVSDTGVGIHPDKMKQIFKAFSQEDSSITKKYGGTGLGLTISNRLLELMDSTLIAESELEKGSCFSFDLSLRAEEDTCDDELPDNLKRVLVVDDNSSSRQILKRMLELKNIEVDEAESGQVALNMLERNAKYDIVIIDYHMPEMDGLQTVKRIKVGANKPESYKDQAIVMLYSSSDDQKLQSDCDSLGIQWRLVKPIKMDEMYEVLAQLGSKSYNETSETAVKGSDHSSCVVLSDLKTILIVEDNEINMYLIKILVQHLAPTSQIIEARNGEEAVELFFEKRPDIVFMDIQMPKMNGIEATMQIRLKEEGNNPIPIIALTAGNESSEKDKCLKAGMSDFMAKPIVRKDLEDMCKKWMGPKETKNIKKEYQPEKIEHLNKKWFRQYATDDIEFRAKLIALAKTEIEESALALQKGILENDLEAINATGHKLKGTSLAIGLPELSRLAVAFELLTELEDEYVNSLFELLLNEIRIVNELLEGELRIKN